MILEVIQKLFDVGSVIQRAFHPYHAPKVSKKFNWYSYRRVPTNNAINEGINKKLVINQNGLCIDEGRHSYFKFIFYAWNLKDLCKCPMTIFPMNQFIMMKEI